MGLAFNSELASMLKKLRDGVPISINAVEHLQKSFLKLTTFASNTKKHNIFSGADKDVAKLRDEFAKLLNIADVGTFKQFEKQLNNVSKRWVNIMAKPKNAFEKFATTVGKILKTTGASVMVFGKTVATALAGILKVSSITALVAGLMAIKNAFAVSKIGNDIDKTSQKVGMSTKTYQKWAYILERCGVEASNLKTAMRGLTSATLGKNGEYFKQLGIDPNGMSQNQLFEATVEALQKVEDKTLRAQLAYKLFGRASAELAPVLALNSAEITRLSYQYELLGASMDGSVIKASVNLTDALQDLRAAWQGLKNTLAQGLMPIITNIIVRLTVLIAKINMVLKAVFGVDLEYESVVDNTQQVTKNTQATTAAVKKLKTLIAGFDELNIFPSQDNGAGIGDGLLDDLEELGSYVSPSIGEILPPEAIAELENFRDNILPGIVEKINELREAWNNGDLGGIFRILGEEFDSPFLTGLGNAIDWVIEKIHELEHWLGDGSKLVGWEMPDSLQEFLGFTEDWEIDWDHLLGLDFDYEGSPLGRFNGWIINIMDSADNTVKKTWEDIKNWFNKSVAPKFTLSYWQNKFKPIKQAWEQGGFLGVVKYVWDGVKGWFSTNVAPKFTSTYWQGKFDSIKNGITNSNIYQKIVGVWNTITGWWNSNVKPKIEASSWKKKFDNIVGGLQNSPIVQKIKETWDKTKQWWQTNVAPKFTLTYWKEKWNIIPNGLGYASIMTKIKEKWAEVKSWWNTNVAPKFTWTYWRDKFNSIKTGLSNVSLVQAGKNIINGLINTLETGINRMVDKINASGIITALKKINVDISLNRIYIPRLAKGGIIDAPTMAMMGEYPGARSNPEIVTPENKLTEIFQNSNDDIVGVLVQGFRQIVQAIDEKDTSISIGDTTIAKSAARGNQQYRLQTGTSLF